MDAGGDDVEVGAFVLDAVPDHLPTGGASLRGDQGGLLRHRLYTTAKPSTGSASMVS